MRRRAVITMLGGAAALPLGARAQQPQDIRRIGVFFPGAAEDSEYQARNAAFLQALQELGWTVGRNIRIDYCWPGSDAERVRRCAAELFPLGPNVILATGNSNVGPLLQTTSTVPIVFVNVTDPVRDGFVESLARPGGNYTGFTCAFVRIGITGYVHAILDRKIGVAPPAADGSCSTDRCPPRS